MSLINSSCFILTLVLVLCYSFSNDTYNRVRPSLLVWNERGQNFKKEIIFLIDKNFHKSAPSLKFEPFMQGCIQLCETNFLSQENQFHSFSPWFMAQGLRIRMINVYLRCLSHHVDYWLGLYLHPWVVNLIQELFLTVGY